MRWPKLITLCGLPETKATTASLPDWMLQGSADKENAQTSPLSQQQHRPRASDKNLWAAKRPVQGQVRSLQDHLQACCYSTGSSSMYSANACQHCWSSKPFSKGVDLALCRQVPGLEAAKHKTRMTASSCSQSTRMKRSVASVPA